MCLDAVRRNRKAFPFSASLLLIVALLDGLSIVTILPLLEFATNSGNKSWLSEAVEPVFVWSGVDPSLEFILVLLLSLLIGKAAVNAFAAYQIAYVTSKTVADYRSLLIEGIANVNWQYFSDQPTGDIANSIMSGKIEWSGLCVCLPDFRCSVQALVLPRNFDLSLRVSIITGVAMIVRFQRLSSDQRRTKGQTDFCIVLSNM